MSTLDQASYQMLRMQIQIRPKKFLLLKSLYSSRERDTRKETNTENISVREKKRGRKKESCGMLRLKVTRTEYTCKDGLSKQAIFEVRNLGWREVSHTNSGSRAFEEGPEAIANLT